jgi:hypothetical protein
MTYPRNEISRIQHRRERLAFEGLPFIVGRPEVGQTGATESAIVFDGNAVRSGYDENQRHAGKVAIVTKVVVNAQATASGSPLLNDWISLKLYNNADVLQDQMPIFLFNKNEGAGELQAQNNVCLEWEPRQPIVIPDGWELRVGGMEDNSGVFTPGGSTCPTVVMVFAVQMDPQDARTLGFNVENSSTAAERFWIQTGSHCGTAHASPGLDETLVAQRLGYSVEITDILVRIQPSTALATITLTEDGGAAPGKTIFEFYNDNPTDPFQRILRPRIFLEDDAGIAINVSANAADRSSVIVIGRYVRNEDKPANAFWAQVGPARLTQAEVSPGGRWAGEGITLNYGDKIPGSDTRRTAVAAGKGRKHVVEGFEIGMRRDSTASNFGIADLDTAVAYALSSGNVSATGNLIQGPRTSQGISPIFLAQGAYQMTAFGVSEVNIPLLEDSALIFEQQIPTVHTPVGSPVEDWSCTVWGRTNNVEGPYTDRAGPIHGE